jgi:hypothetical protein
MISEVQPAADQTGQGRAEQRTKYKFMRKGMRSYRQVFESLITASPMSRQSSDVPE